jgi:hypothetical protein
MIANYDTKDSVFNCPQIRQLRLHPRDVEKICTNPCNQTWFDTCFPDENKIQAALRSGYRGSFLTALSGKDTGLYAKGKGPNPADQGKYHAYELFFGECSTAWDANCAKELTEDRRQHWLQTIKGAFNYTSLVSEGCKVPCTCSCYARRCRLWRRNLKHCFGGRTRTHNCTTFDINNTNMLPSCKRYRTRVCLCADLNLPTRDLDTRHH